MQSISGESAADMEKQFLSQALEQDDQSLQDSLGLLILAILEALQFHFRHPIPCCGLSMSLF